MSEQAMDAANAADLLERVPSEIPAGVQPDIQPDIPLDRLADQAAAIPSFSWSGYFMTIAVLCLLLAALWLALRWLKRRGGLRRFGGNADLELESRLSLGPKKNLLIVRLRDRRLLLGVTEHHVSKLAELPLYHYDDEDEEADAAEAKGKHA